VGKLLCQLRLNHRSSRPLPVATAMKAVVQGNHLKPFDYHLFDDLPNWLKEADATIISASFRDEDCDNPPELDGYLAFVPNGMNKSNQHVPFFPCAHIIQSLLLVFLLLCPI